MSGRLYDAYDSVMKMKCLQCHQQYLNLSTPPPLLLKKKKAITITGTVKT